MLKIKDEVNLKELEKFGFEQIWFGYTWKHLVEKVEEQNGNN